MMDSHPPNLDYSTVIAQLQRPAIVRQYDNEKVLDNLSPGLYTGNDLIKASLGGLVQAVQGSSRTTCYRPSNEPMCFEFVVGRDGSLLAAFALDSDSRGPIMLNYAILMREGQRKPAVLMYYVDNKEGDKRDKFWPMSKNVPYISVDDGMAARQIQQAYDKFKLEGPKKTDNKK